MAGSLFDQLKKSGLVDDKKAKQVQRQKQQQSKQNKANKAKKGQVVESDAAKLAAKAAAEKAERDRQLNLQRQQEQLKKAQQAEVLQIIQSNQINRFEGETAFNFADDNKVKTLNVNKKTHQQLVAGTVRVARLNAGYALIPESAVEKIMQRDASVLIPLEVVDNSISDEDKDYYAQFEIPDDLVW